MSSRPDYIIAADVISAVVFACVLVVLVAIVALLCAFYDAVAAYKLSVLAAA